MNTFIIKNEDMTYPQLKEDLIKFFDAIVCGDKKIQISEIDEIRKYSIAVKAFDLVSISMSFFAYLEYKTQQASYYRALTTLNDAKYLSFSSESYLAQKINSLFIALLELEEGNHQVALELIDEAYLIQVDEPYNFNEKILEIKTKINKINQTKLISSAPPSFIMSGGENEDPLIALLKVGRTIAVETNMDTLLTIIAQEIKVALNADRCTVFLLDEEKNQLWSKVALGMNMKEIRFDAGLGLAGHVASSGNTVNIKNAYEDERFNKNIDIQTGYKTETILCMPIRNMSHQVIGVFQVLNKKDGYFTEKDEDLLVAISSSAGIALENANLFNKQKRFIEEQKSLFSSFIDTLSASIDARDKITSGHSKRVTMYTVLICEKMKIDEKQKEIIRYASLLHDIGKIGIRDSVLQKEGQLTEEEYAHIQEHAHITNDILSKIFFSKDFEDVAKIASSHHEKYDGSGYYQGISSDDIPLGGRILAVSDVFDAITSKRHYRSKMKIENALGILIKDSGTHFDKKMVDVFLSVETNKLIEVMTTDTTTEISKNDEIILEKYTMLDLYLLLTRSNERILTAEEKRFISAFLKYYNDEETT